MKSSLFLLLILLFIPCVSASSVTFSDLNLGGTKEIMIYEVNGSSTNLIGTYNTTDSVALNPSLDYVVVLKPGVDHWYSDPFNSFELLKVETPSLLSIIVYVIVVLGVGRWIFR